MQMPADTTTCSECDGDGCPFCLQTGKRLFRIGERVVWDNQEGSLAPMNVREEEYRTYVGKIYRVVALMAHPGDTERRYYVGIDAKMDSVTGKTSTTLVFDTNLRPCTEAARESTKAKP